jgi:cellobiose-specific phosphotransferase system component IIA
VRVRVRVRADTPVPNLQESLLKIDTEIKEAHNVHQKLIKNTKTAATRFHAGE